MTGFGRKAMAAIMAGLMTVSTAVPAGIAIAEEIQPSVSQDDQGNTQTGTGSTDVTVQYKQVGEDVGGTEDGDNNPDENSDGLGDNIAFTVPISINYVADAQGKLTGPSASAAYIENESSFSIHASAFRTEAEDGWTIVDDDTTVTATDAVDFQFGPETDKAGNADAFDYLATAPNKVKIADVVEDAPYAADWNMAPKASTGVDDRVQLTTTGDIHNVTKDLTQRTKMAEIHTFVTAGNVSAQTQVGFGAVPYSTDNGTCDFTWHLINNVVSMTQSYTADSDGNFPNSYDFNSITNSLRMSDTQTEYYPDGTFEFDGVRYRIFLWAIKDKSTGDLSDYIYSDWGSAMHDALGSAWSDYTTDNAFYAFANNFELVAQIGRVH